MALAEALFRIGGNEEIDATEMLTQLGYTKMPVISNEPSWRRYRREVLRVDHQIEEFSDRASLLQLVISRKLTSAADRDMPSDFCRKRATYFSTTDGWLGVSSSDDTVQHNGEQVDEMLKVWGPAEWSRLLGNGDVQVVIQLGGMAASDSDDDGELSADDEEGLDIPFSGKWNVAVLIRTRPEDLASVPPIHQLLLRSEPHTFVSRLVASGLDVNTPVSAAGHNALAMAAEMGDEHGIAALLHAGANPHVSPPGVSYVTLSARAASPGCVRILLGALGPERAREEENALREALSLYAHAAAADEGTCARLREVARLLLEAGVYPALTFDVFEQLGNTRMAALLLLHGANPSAPHLRVQRGIPNVLVWLLSPRPRIGETIAERESAALPWIRLFAAHGASRVIRGSARVDEPWPDPQQQPLPAGFAFLQQTRHLRGPLQYAQYLPLEHVRDLVAAGADMHAPGDGGAPSALELALAALESEQPPMWARIVAFGRSLWSRAVHASCSAEMRRKVPHLLFVGKQLALSHGDVRLEHVWESSVMPLILPRVVDSYGPPGSAPISPR